MSSTATGGIGVNAEGHDIGEEFAGVFIDDVEDLQAASGGGDVELELSAQA